MDKAALHQGHDYAFRENTRGWERGEDPPIRVTLLRHLGGGKNLVRFPDGCEVEVRSAQLIRKWSPKDIDDLLRKEEHERAFRASTTKDRTASDAVALVFATVIEDPHTDSDRAWLSPEGASKVLAEADATEDPLDLSPFAFRDDDGDLCLPLPVAVMLARRIAEGNPHSIIEAVDAALSDLQAKGYLDIVPNYYKPAWDMALSWAGEGPKELPPTEISPSVAYKELWERLRGQGLRRSRTEEHVWWVRPDQLTSLGHLLAHVARYVGRVTIRPLDDGKVRLALDYVVESKAFSPVQVQNLALSLSGPQARMLAEIREAGDDGAEIPTNQGQRNTMESLVGYGLAWESEVDEGDPASRFSRGRFRLSDAGWRVLEELGPRSV